MGPRRAAKALVLAIPLQRHVADMDVVGLLVEVAQVDLLQLVSQGDSLTVTKPENMRVTLDHDSDFKA